MRFAASTQAGIPMLKVSAWLRRRVFRMRFCPSPQSRCLEEL